MAAQSSPLLALFPAMFNMKTSDKEPKEHNCPFCRFVGGITLLATSLFVAYHAKKTHRPTHRIVSTLLAAGFLGVGTARLFDLPPFHKPPTPPSIPPLQNNWPDCIFPPQEETLQCSEKPEVHTMTGGECSV